MPDKDPPTENSNEPAITATAQNNDIAAILNAQYRLVAPVLRAWQQNIAPVMAAMAPVLNEMQTVAARMTRILEEPALSVNWQEMAAATAESPEPPEPPPAPRRTSLTSDRSLDRNGSATKL